MLWAVSVLFVLGYSSTDFWAVLVAGSRGIMNYRHQADVCHTYNLLRDGGIPADHIVTMMFDDVAWSGSNPLIGRLYNEPNGPDVYSNCLVDHRRDSVNLETFTKVLTGEDLHVFPTIHSSDESTVLISFVDHGEPGQLLFPTTGLNGPTLLSIINSMKYRKLVIYVEACFAGSVFETVQLPKNVIAVTASNASESSWGTFCPTPKHPDADAINGIHIGTCLGDLFEVSWKRDLENRLSTGLMTNSTLTDHIEAVKDIVSRKSNVMVYGDTELLNEPLSNIFPLTCRTNSHKIQPSDDLLVESSMRQREPSFATPPVVLDYTLVAN